MALIGELDEKTSEKPVNDFTMTGAKWSLAPTLGARKGTVSRTRDQEILVRSIVLT